MHVCTARTVAGGGGVGWVSVAGGGEAGVLQRGPGREMRVAVVVAFAVGDSGAGLSLFV